MSFLFYFGILYQCGALILDYKTIPSRISVNFVILTVVWYLDLILEFEFGHYHVKLRVLANLKLLFSSSGKLMLNLQVKCQIDMII